MKIMIVEDEAVSRKVMLNKLESIGECTAVSSGKEAISLFDKATIGKKPFDLIILDISMPDMDGIKVLDIIRKKENKLGIKKTEQIKIIMVTASMRQANIKKCISLGCNSYISKPFNTQKIYQELERLGFDIPDIVKKQSKNQKSYTDLVAQIIKRFNKGEIELPVLPHIVKEIQKFLDNKNASIEDLSAIVEKDAVISAKLILAANSALFQGVDKVSTLNEALVRLGLKTSISVITAITSKNLFDSDNETLKSVLNKVWVHSLACGCCCKLIAEELKDNTLESVFLMGIIHDIGKVILLKAIADISPDEPLEDQKLLAAVQDVHTIFGAVLVKKWGFSDKHIRATELHHWEIYPDKTEKELLITHLANALVSTIGFPSFFIPAKTDSKTNFKENVLIIMKQLQMKQEMIEKIGDQVTDMMIDLSDQF